MSDARELPPEDNQELILKKKVEALYNRMRSISEVLDRILEFHFPNTPKNTPDIYSIFSQLDTLDDQMRKQRIVWAEYLALQQTNMGWEKITPDNLPEIGSDALLYSYKYRDIYWVSDVRRSYSDMSTHTFTHFVRVKPPNIITTPIQ